MMGGESNTESLTCHLQWVHMGQHRMENQDTSTQATELPIIYFFVTNLPGRVIETQFDFTLSPSKRASLLVSLATLASWRHNLATFQFNCKGPKAGWHHCTEQCQNIF